MPQPPALENYLNPIFVETGTYEGNSIKLALGAGFDKIFSIEIDPEYVKKATKPIN